MSYMSTILTGNAALNRRLNVTKLQQLKIKEQLKTLQHSSQQRCEELLISPEGPYTDTLNVNSTCMELQ